MHILSVSTWMQNLIWDKAEPNKILLGYHPEEV